MKRRLYEVQTQTTYCSLEKLETVLASHSKDIEKYAYILHDKDTREDGTLKEPHFHCMMKLFESRRLNDVASWFGLAEDYIQYSKSKKYDNMLLYLIHENAPEKHQYDEEEVKANFDYSEYMSTIRNKLKKTETNKRVSEIIESIATGAIREYNIHDFVSVSEYDKFKSHIKSAFEYRSIMLEQQNSRNMEVVYLYGSGGTGKSTYAETIAKARGFSFKRSASERDPLGSYKGQDAFILDDVRGSTFNFQDWMGILDNFQDRDGSSRFHDKHFTECKLLIITTTVSPEVFWKELSKDRPNEDKHQFYRRVKTIIHMTANEVKCSRYDEATHGFGEEYILENNTYNKFSICSESREEQKEKLAISLGVDKSLFEQKVRVETPVGVLPTKTATEPKIRLLDDTGANRLYLVAENVNALTKTKIEQFASELSNTL